MLSCIGKAPDFFARALQQYHDRPFEVAAAGYRPPQRTDKPQADDVSAKEFGRLAKGI